MGLCTEDSTNQRFGLSNMAHRVGEKTTARAPALGLAPIIKLGTLQAKRAGSYRVTSIATLMPGYIGLHR
jgi:hypothetical protein